MKILEMPRGAGKTTRMLAWLREDEKRILLVHDNVWKRFLQEAHADVADRIYAADAMTRHQFYGMDPRLTVGVDELGLVLTKLLGLPVVLATHASEEQGEQDTLFEDDFPDPSDMPPFEANPGGWRVVSWFRPSQEDRA